MSFSISKNRTVSFTMNILTEAIKQILINLSYRTVIHSDQEFHYQNQRWVRLLKENKIFQSMSRKITCPDNKAMESFFHIMKAEAFYQKQTDIYETLVSQISVRVHDCNVSRIKTKLGYKSPVQY